MSIETDIKRKGVISEIIRRLGDVETRVRKILAGGVGGGGASVGRELLTAARTYYVRTDGNDSNTGLVNSSGGAFLTIQKAIDVTVALDQSIYTVTIQVADGTYTNKVELKSYIGANPILLYGNATTPANCIISTTSNNAIEGLNLCRQWNIKGFKIQTTTYGNGVVVNGGAIISIVGNMEYGTIAAGYAHLQTIAGGKININANYTVSGNATTHYQSVGGILTANFITVTFSGSRTFTYFAYASALAYLEAEGNTWSGPAVTATRYYAVQNSVINTNAGGAGYFPGNVAGSVASGGQYT